VIRVLLVGQGRWARVLCEGLSEYAGGATQCQVWSLDTPRQALSLVGVTAALRSDVVVRVGFRPGAHTPYGIGFDLLWRILLGLNRRARAFVYWIGTDVQDTLRDSRSGRSMRRLNRILRRARSIAGSDRLATELAEVGVEAKLVPFPGGLGHAPEKAAPLPEVFTVLSYIPDARPVFYGGPQILEAARALPHARFLVAGGSGTWTDSAPPNVEFLGWIDDMPTALDGSTAVARMVEHDSIGGTAIEALLHARHLVYSYDLPHAIHVEFGDTSALIAALAELEQSDASHALRPNTEGRAWALVEFDRERRFRVLASAFTEEVSR